MNRSSQLLKPGSSIPEPRLSRTRATDTSTSSTSLPRSRSSVSEQQTPEHVQRIHTISLDRLISKEKDNRPIYDKKWQADMLRKTLKYFTNDMDASPIIKRVKNIPPLNNNIFVKLVQIVLKNIDHRFKDLTTENYVELLPKYLTTLMYPGNLTENMMRTANTMCTWPHILAILSWLVELPNRIKICNEIINDNMYAIPSYISLKEKRELQMRQLHSFTLLPYYSQWVKCENTEENWNEIFEYYPQELREIYNFDVYKANQLKQSANRLSRINQIEEAVIKKFNEEHVKLTEEENEFEKEKSRIKKKTAEQEEFITYIETKIAAYKRDNKILRDKNKKIKSKRKKLEQKKQSMMEQQKEIELPITEDLITETTLNTEQKKDVQSISEKSDLKVRQIKQEIEENSSTFNIEVFKASMKHPELKSFAIEEGDVFSSEFLKNVEENIKEAKKFHLELEENLNKETEELNSLKIQNKQKQEESAKLQRQREAATFKLLKKTEVRGDQLCDFEDDVKSKNHKLETLYRKVAEFSKKIPNLAPLKATVAAKSREYEILRNKLQKNAYSMLGVFENIEKEVALTIVPEYKAIRQRLSQALEQKLVNTKPTIKEDENQNVE